jgi:hypothetical protein
MSVAETKKEALIAFDAFIETWGVKYDKAVECLIKDRDALLAFYDCPAEHWKHLRTTNVIESTFATVRHRTVRSTGPHAVYSAFEFDTGSGLLRWISDNGNLLEPEQYRIVQQGSGSNDWVAVYSFTYVGSRLEDELTSAVMSFLRIRPWALPGFEEERGRFFMITSVSDVVVGTCHPR